MLTRCQKSDNTLTQTDAEAAEFFKSVFVMESSEPVPEFSVETDINTEVIDHFEIGLQPAEVYKKLASLKV